MEWFGEEKKILVFSFLQVATLQFRGKLDGVQSSQFWTVNLVEHVETLDYAKNDMDRI